MQLQNSSQYKMEKLNQWLLTCKIQIWNQIKFKN